MTNNNLSGFYSLLMQKMVSDVADCYWDNLIIQKALRRDAVEIRLRVRQDGLSFLTKDLPRLGKAFDNAIGTNTPFLLPTGFKPLVRQDGTVGPTVTALPNLFGSLFCLVFKDDGTLQADVKNVAVRWAVISIRQLVYTLYKLKIPYNEEDIQRVVDSFLRTETDLETTDKGLLECPPRVTDAARNLATSVFGSLDHREIHPRHGPGAVATGESHIDKTAFGRIYQALDVVYPFTEYFMFNLNHVCDDYKRIQRLESPISGTAKVVLVDKDSRGPRLISCEPPEYQWIQQGLAARIVQRLESSPRTRGHVNFTDQSINRRLALEGSKTGKWVTLDMKEASDRVSTELVKTIFRDCPCLEGLLAARSTHTKLPNGTVIELRKYAPMGSALCFPVEAFVFFALAVAVIHIEHHYTVKQAVQMVYVYGDDIITTPEVYGSVMQTLERYGLLFNRDKCCTAGPFRESCGCEAFQGSDVTPTRLRAVAVSSATYSPDILMGYIAFHNAMYLRGYYRVCSYVAAYIERLWGAIPREYPSTDSVVGWSHDHAMTYCCDSQGVISAIRREDCTGLSATLCTWNPERLSHPDAPFDVSCLFKRRLNGPWKISKWVVCAKSEKTTHEGYPEMLRRTLCGLSRSYRSDADRGKYTLRRGASLRRRWLLWRRP